VPFGEEINIGTDWLVWHPNGDKEPLYVNVDVLVRDVTIEALQEITGETLAQRSSKEAQAKAWQDWWSKRQRNQTEVSFYGIAPK
jgi:hypothetical protein